MLPFGALASAPAGTGSAASGAPPEAAVGRVPAAPVVRSDGRTAHGPLLFISDLHLSPAIPRTVEAFKHFIEISANQAQADYILGDLFESWIGDDELVTPWAVAQCAVMRSLSERGIPLYVMHGNRDFLLGARFAAAAGATLLPDPCVLEAFGRRLVLTHGDALCTLDVRYQRFRRLTRRRWVQRCFLSWPLSWRLALARKLRQRPMQSHSYQPKWDVTHEAVQRLLLDGASHTVIHGHTHRPAHHLEDGSERWVLPDWDLDHGTVRGGYLQLDATGISVEPLAV